MSWSLGGPEQLWLRELLEPTQRPSAEREPEHGQQVRELVLLSQALGLT
jgi:hypothetical protein